MFSALLNAQNRSGSSTTPITGAVFQYSNNGTTWTNTPVGGIGITYDSLTYQVRVGSITPAGATYTITSQGTATNQGQTAQMVIVGSGSYSGTFTSPLLVITQRTITATSAYPQVPIDPDSCNIGLSVSGFNITLGNLVSGATGVTLSVLYGADGFVYNNNLCAVSGNVNVEGAVSSLIGTNPYQNVIYNTNGVKSFYTNYNNNPNYFWCVINLNEWESGGQTIGNPNYNSNYSSPVVSFAGSPAPFTNSCQT